MSWYYSGRRRGYSKRGWGMPRVRSNAAGLQAAKPALTHSPTCTPSMYGAEGSARTTCSGLPVGAHMHHVKLHSD